MVCKQKKAHGCISVAQTSSSTFYVSLGKFAVSSPYSIPKFWESTEGFYFHPTNQATHTLHNSWTNFYTSFGRIEVTSTKTCKICVPGVQQRVQNHIFNISDLPDKTNCHSALSNRIRSERGRVRGASNVFHTIATNLLSPLIQTNYLPAFFPSISAVRPRFGVAYYAVCS